MCSQPVERALHAGAAGPHDVGIDHGGGNVVMAEEFLHGADVGAGLESGGGERVAEGRAGGALGQADAGDGGPDCFVDGGLVEVVTPECAGTGIDREVAGGEGVLPAAASNQPGRRPRRPRGRSNIDHHHHHLDHPDPCCPEAFGTLGHWDHRTTGPQDYGTTRLRDHKTTGPRLREK